MKTMKKLASIVLALVMALALAVPALAANDIGDITIKNPLPGGMYDVYKIFDETYDDAGHYTYTLPSDSAWMSIVETYFDVTAQAANPAVSNAVLKETYIKDGEPLGSFAASFAKALQKALEDKTVTATPVTEWTAPETDTPTEYTFRTGALGYYFVTSSIGSLCNLTNANPTATIYDKNDTPDIEKEVDDEDKIVGVGQVLTYTLTGKVPSTTGYETYTYYMSDSMTEGLTFDKETANLIVKVGNATLTDNFTVIYNDNGFRVDIDVMKLQDKVGETITVEYQATVNSNAITRSDETNEVTLTYSRNPDGGEDHTTKEVKVYTAKIVVDKYEGNKDDAKDTSTKLAGAKFILVRVIDNVGMDETTGDNTMNVAYEYYVFNKETNEVSWTENMEEATVVETDEKGAASFEGLANGGYYLIETEAPEGYNKLTDPVEVVIESADAVTAAPAVTAPVANYTGPELPSTGGIGTTIFYIGGGILVAGAAILLITKKRMGSAD